MKKAVLLFILLTSFYLSAANLKFCSVVDESKHRANQKLLKEIIGEELATANPKMTADERGRYLSSKVSVIGRRLIERGFSLDAYGVPEIDKDSMVSFNYFTLWEGENNERIPLTFFVFVWPNEEFARKYNPKNPENNYYASNIHSHPISCAFTVLSGTLYQRNFERLTKRNVRMVSEEKFEQYQGSIDHLGAPFIHQMYAKGSGPAFSLHAYGMSTEAKVMQTFQKTQSTHSYLEVAPN